MHTIGRMAALAGVSPDALRYYEKERLIAPASRTAAGYRLYGDEALRRIRFIRSAQHCGFTLTDIRELLELKRADAACCEDVRSLAVRKKLHIERKLKALREMSAALDGLIEGCAGGEAETARCAILNSLESSLQEVQR